MYATHSKNINKNKSFDPLNGKNQYTKAKKEAEEKERQEVAQKRLVELDAEKRAFKFDSMLKGAEGGGGVTSTTSSPSSSGATVGGTSSSLKFTTANASTPPVIGDKRLREGGGGTEVDTMPVVVPSLSDGRDRDARWIFKTDEGVAGAGASGATAEEEQMAKSAVPAPATGRISKEEAHKMQLDLDRAKKQKNDPLFRAEQLEARLRGGGGGGGVGSTSASSTTSATHNTMPATAAPSSSKQRLAAALALVRKKK